MDYLERFVVYRCLAPLPFHHLGRGEEWWPDRCLALLSQLQDLDPEVGRQRGQELLAMLMEAPLSKASSVREPPGLRQSLGPRPGSELLSTAVPSQSQTFSQPWIPLGTAFAQGNRTSHPNGFAL
ncbi:unnamed protein product [Cladocopium goreaui]|uniref:Uncharacterized protein n=1 Tax=Cladocopium goreaui TaxID=2562237 RepID=A0A9P1BQE6_9DINO|nr:unnamed protein product [Cladocopium goreaui]